MDGERQPESETDIRAVLKRAREVADEKPLVAWKLLYDGLPAVHEGVRGGRLKPTVLDAFLNEMAELSPRVPSGELGKQFAAQRKRTVWVEKTFEDMQEKLSDARREMQPIRDELEAEKQRRERAETAALRAEAELKSLTHRLVSTTGQAGDAQSEARNLKEAVKKADSVAAKSKGEAETLRSLVRTRESEVVKLSASADEENRRADEATAGLVQAMQDLDGLRAKHDALVGSIARGDLLPKETVEKLLEEARERTAANQPVEVEAATGALRARMEDVSDTLREAAENERSLMNQLEFLKKQLENQRPALEEYEAVCEALGLDPTKPGALQTKVLGLLAKSIEHRGDQK